VWDRLLNGPLLREKRATSKWKRTQEHANKETPTNKEHTKKKNKNLKTCRQVGKRGRLPIEKNEGTARGKPTLRKKARRVLLILHQGGEKESPQKRRVDSLAPTTQTGSYPRTKTCSKKTGEEDAPFLSKRKEKRQGEKVEVAQRKFPKKKEKGHCFDY